MVRRARAEAAPPRAEDWAWSGTRARLLYCRARLSLSAGFICALASLLAPQAHGFLRRPIGEREQHALLPGGHAQRSPRGDDEDVLGLEIEALRADGGAAL